jgi:hypothetical protein
VHEWCRDTGSAEVDRLVYRSICYELDGRICPGRDQQCGIRKKLVCSRSAPGR